MLEWMRFFQMVVCGIVCIAGFLWGGMDGLLTTLLVFMVLDDVSGVVVAYKEKRLSSKVGFWGLVKKCMILALVNCTFQGKKRMIFRKR